jgi:ribosomal protein L37E
MKRKYWYRTEKKVCVLCGRETVTRYRVYNKERAKIIWTDTACDEHF